MRPQSEIRVDLAAALVDGPGTCKQLAQRTGWSIGMTREALNNMVRAGQAHKPRTVRVPGVKRPVPVYARVPLPAFDLASRSGHAALGGVLSGWARWPSFVNGMEARM